MPPQLRPPPPPPTAVWPWCSFTSTHITKYQQSALFERTHTHTHRRDLRVIHSFHRTHTCAMCATPPVRCVCVCVCARTRAILLLRYEMLVVSNCFMRASASAHGTYIARMLVKTQARSVVLIVYAESVREHHCAHICAVQCTKHSRTLAVAHARTHTHTHTHAQLLASICVRVRCGGDGDGDGE